MKNNYDYMSDIYDVLDAPIDNEPEDEFIMIDEEDGDYEYDNWGEDIIFIGGDPDEDVIYDLGDDYIPLPQGDVEYEAIIIDENYVLDEYERDVADSSDVIYLDEVEQFVELVETTEPDAGFELKEDLAASVVKLPESKTADEEISIMNDLNQEDDRISKAIAKEYMEEAEINAELLPGDEIPSEDFSWIDNDIFGNDIDVILAEDPNEQEQEDDDYVDGSFEEWIQNNGKSI